MRKELFRYFKRLFGYLEGDEMGLGLLMIFVILFPVFSFKHWARWWIFNEFPRYNFITGDMEVSDSVRFMWDAKFQPTAVDKDPVIMYQGQRYHPTYWYQELLEQNEAQRQIIKELEERLRQHETL